MTETEHYQLPQWEAGDPVRVDELRGAMAGIDAALAENKAAAAAAQSTADTARTEAAVLSHKTGSYLGNGTNQAVNVGFMPKAVYITGDSIDAPTGGYSMMACGAFGSGKFDVNNSGFRVSVSSTSGPNLNASGRRYLYVAFR